MNETPAVENQEQPERRPEPPEGRPGARIGDRPDERLDRLQRRLVQFAAARGWEPYHTPKNLAVALSVEASNWSRSSSG